MLVRQQTAHGMRLRDGKPGKSKWENTNRNESRGLERSREALNRNAARRVRHMVGVLGPGRGDWPRALVAVLRLALAEAFRRDSCLVRLVSCSLFSCRSCFCPPGLFVFVLFIVPVTPSSLSARHVSMFPAVRFIYAPSPFPSPVCVSIRQNTHPMDPSTGLHLRTEMKTGRTASHPGGLVFFFFFFSLVVRRRHTRTVGRKGGSVGCFLGRVQVFLAPSLACCLRRARRARTSAFLCFSPCTASTKTPANFLARGCGWQTWARPRFSGRLGCSGSIDINTMLQARNRVAKPVGEIRQHAGGERHRAAQEPCGQGICLRAVRKDRRPAHTAQTERKQTTRAFRTGCCCWLPLGSPTPGAAWLGWQNGHSLGLCASYTCPAARVVVLVSSLSNCGHIGCTGDELSYADASCAELFGLSLCV